MSGQWFGVHGSAGIVQAQSGFDVTRGVVGLTVRPRILFGGSASTWVRFAVPAICEAKVATPGLEFDLYDGWIGPSAAVNLVGVRIAFSGASKEAKVQVDRIEVHDGEELVALLSGTTLGRTGRLMGAVDREFSIPPLRIRSGVVVGVRCLWDSAMTLVCRGAGILLDRVEGP